MAQAIPIFGEETMRELLELLRKSKQSTSKQRSPGVAVPNVRHTFTFFNDASETIPPYAALRITGADVPRRYVKVAKPAGPQSLYAINQPREVAVGKKGQCYIQHPTTALYTVDSAYGPPAFGEIWGPKNNQWELAKGWPGFMVIGAVEESPDRVLVAPSSMRLRGVPASAIPPRVGLQDGSGTMALYGRLAGGLMVDLERTATTYNWTGTELPAGFLYRLEPDGGDLLIVGRDCSAVFDPEE